MMLLMLQSSRLVVPTVIIIYTTLIVAGNGKDVVIKSKDSTVVFSYREGIEGESGLHECESNEACNIVHNRFWMPILTQRLCRCPGGQECPWHWNDGNTGNNSSSISINNRSLLQFCSSARLETVRTCSRKEAAITVLGKGDSSNSVLHPLIVKANCRCSKPYFWKLTRFKYELRDGTVFQVYKCAKQRMCDSLDFCGHVRADLFSVYYRCSCPEKHWCIFTNKTAQKTKDNVQELVYSGAAYKAYCTPHT